ncbi:MAG: GIY-YIG nuclease family protein, partial [Deltaproteobacteria bacterium]|nr:GIY-YIG nuclease family protein [Deltaproteobacteria bacterium]
MAKKKAPSPSKREKSWFLYILECCDGTFYTGITNDIQKRFEAHNRGRGARYLENPGHSERRIPASAPRYRPR